MAQLNSRKVFFRVGLDSAFLLVNVVGIYALDFNGFKELSGILLPSPAIRT